MSEPAQKCENFAIFKQNYTLELFIALKMAYSCCFGLRGNLYCPDFLQKKFYNINHWLMWNIVGYGNFCICSYQGAKNKEEGFFGIYENLVGTLCVPLTAPSWWTNKMWQLLSTVTLSTIESGSSNESYLDKVKETNSFKPARPYCGDNGFYFILPKRQIFD